LHIPDKTHLHEFLLIKKTACSVGLGLAYYSLFPLTQYYSIYQPSTIHSTSRTGSKYLILALVGKPDRKKEHVKNRCSVENQMCECRKERKKNCKRGHGPWGTAGYSIPSVLNGPVIPVYLASWLLNSYLTPTAEHSLTPVSAIHWKNYSALVSRK